jgi:ComF family protein
MLGGLLNLFLPLQNIEFKNIDTYLSDNEIDDCKSKLKKLNKFQSDYLESIFVVSDYNNIIIFDLIKRSKYNSEFRICDSFADAIYHKIFRDGGIFIPDPDILIPVPVDPSRIIVRGYNIPTEICKSLSKKIDIPYLDILFKTTTTVAQNKLQRKDRLENLKGIFKLKTPIIANFSNKEIIWIIDDVSTTGATLTECAKIIKKSYPYLKIYGIVVSSN